MRQGFVHSDRRADQSQNDNDGDRNLTGIVGEGRTRNECNQRDDGALGQDQLTAGVPAHRHLESSEGVIVDVRRTTVSRVVHRNQR